MKARCLRTIRVIFDTVTVDSLSYRQVLARPFVDLLYPSGTVRRTLTRSYLLSPIASNHGSFNKSTAVGRFTGLYCRISLNNMPTASTSPASISGGASLFRNVSRGSISTSVPENQVAKYIVILDKLNFRGEYVMG